MRVVVGMSGGVDSSLAATLLAEQGHEVVGVTLKLWPCAELDGGFTKPDACCSPTETRDARAVAVGRGIAHYVVDAEDAFRAAVVEDFLDGYARGETPSPCVRCNETVKFGTLWEHARALGAERVGTGHYARIARVGERIALRRSADAAKDQTWFLCTLSQEQLAVAEFPVGAMSKDEVRAAARTRGLSTADKDESMDLCFLGTGGVGELLRRERPEAFRPGVIRHLDGRVVGEHRGLGAHTVGQRKGLGIAGAGEPLFVAAIDRERNELLVGPRAALEIRQLRLRACTWHLAPPGPEGLRCVVRPRHRSAPLPAQVQRDGEDAVLLLDRPVLRPAPGQVCAIYDPADDLCLGGGWIG